MKKAVHIVTLLALMLGIAAEGGAKAKVDKKSVPPAETAPASSDFDGRAISLKALQSKLKDCQNSRNCPEELLHFYGLTDIDGYLVDEAEHDVVLFGRADASLPPLNVQDFIIALRSAWMQYAEHRGNTIYYSNPGCSIDPDAKVMQMLQGIGQEVMRGNSPDGVEKGISQWRDICGYPQKVKVLGIPFDTQFAWTMVKADYDMKRLVDGSDKLAIADFSSLTDMTLDRIKKDIAQGQSSSIPLAGMNRFWFYPGENQYLEDEGVVRIDQCPVLLLTEAEYLNQKGQITGQGQASPLAMEFTRNFSARYATIAKERSIYKELENLFRLVALAKILKFKEDARAAGLDIGYFLAGYTIPETPVHRELPGLCNIKKFEHCRELKNGYETARLWVPSCGGVGIEISVSQKNFVKDRSRKLYEFRSSVLGARATPDALFWDYPRQKRVRLEEEKALERSDV